MCTITLYNVQLRFAYCTVHNVQCTLCTVQYARVHCTIRTMYMCVVGTPHTYTVYYVQYTAYSVQCTMYNVHCTRHTCTLYTCILYRAYCTPYHTVQRSVYSSFYCNTYTLYTVQYAGYHTSNVKFTLIGSKVI